MTHCCILFLAIVGCNLRRQERPRSDDRSAAADCILVTARPSSKRGLSCAPSVGSPAVRLMTSVAHDAPIGEGSCCKWRCLLKLYSTIGQLLTGDPNHEKEIYKSIKMGWSAYGSHYQTLTGNLPLSLKRKVNNQCIHRC